MKNLCSAARISNSMFPSAPPIRNIPEGSSFISLERVVSESATAWGGYRRASSPEKIPGGRGEGWRVANWVGLE